jgi:hypothetical protein
VPARRIRLLAGAAGAAAPASAVVVVELRRRKMPTLHHHDGAVEQPVAENGVAGDFALHLREKHRGL